jgi:hypothetical protein
VVHVDSDPRLLGFGRGTFRCGPKLPDLGVITREIMKSESILAKDASLLAVYFSHAVFATAPTRAQGVMDRRQASARRILHLSFSKCAT